MASLARRLSTALVLTLAALPAFARPVPDLHFKDLSGHTEKLSDLRGSITVVSFWATWCTPCREELPRLVQLQKEYAAKGIRFVAISLDRPRDRGKIEPYLAAAKITLDVWVDADGETLDRLRLGDEIPATMVLDKNGEVAGRILGEAHPEDIGIYLDWLLDNRRGDPPQTVIKRY